MRFTSIIIIAQAIVAAGVMASPVPADPLPTTPEMNCNTCLLTNIKKVGACSWWNWNQPWPTPGDWTFQQRSCICALGSSYAWLDDCQKPNWCTPSYVGSVKNMYDQWRPSVCY
ncbi:hypothetical protein BGZ94_005237 [Podila epigama]|nr:hypothetical protein BGZ94_005237 [Podila epigama]